MGKHPRRRPSLRTATILVAIAVTIMATASYWLTAIGNWLSMPTTVTSAAVIAVHGGGQIRTRYSAELYRKGIAPVVWHTGLAQSERSITAILRADGVPSAAYAYYPSTSTWTDAEAIAREARAQNVTSILVITDWWHSRRALCADRRQFQGTNISIYFAPSPSPAGPDNWWRNPATRRPVLMELAKLAYYAARYGQLPWNC